MSTNKSAIQNYLFATRYLAPIGPSLRLEDLKLLKPRLNSHRQLVQQLQLDPTIYDQLLNDELEQCAADLRQGAMFDAANLCDRLEQNLAQTVSVTAEEIRLMLMALSVNGSLTGAALRAASQPAKEATVPSSRKSTFNAAPIDIRSGPAIRSASSNAKSLIANETGKSENATPADFVAVTHLMAKRLCDAAYVSDCLRMQADLPLGFYMEMPEELIETTDAADPNIRRASWQLLATMSGQFNQGICMRLPAGSRWRQTMALDSISERSFETEYQIHVQGICSETGAPGISCSDLSLSLLHPVVGPLFLQLLQHVHQWHGADPQRFSV